MLQGDVNRPEKLDELICLAEKLSNGITFLRADFYVLEDGSIKFGECTFYPMSGFETWKPDEIDRKMGEMLKLPLAK